MELNVEKLQFDSIEKRNFNVNVSAKELVEDGAKILCITAFACCGRSEVLNNEILVEGIVKFTAIIKKQDEIKRIERTERFNLTEKISGNYSDSFMLASAKAEKIRAYLEAGSLMLTCTVNVSAIHIIPNTIECVNNLEGEEYRKKENLVNLFKSSLAKQLRFNFSEDTELSPRVPEIQEILSINAFPEVKEAHISAGQLIIGGEISLQTVYNSIDEYEPIIQVTDKFDFSQIIELNEINIGNPTVVLDVEDINGIVSANEQGEMRIITYSIGICGYAYAGDARECNVISDAYSLNNKIICKKEKIEFGSITDKVHTLTSKSISVRVPEGKTPVSRVNSVSFCPDVLACKIVDSKAILTCSGEVGAIYTASGTGDVEGFNTTVDFDIIVENNQFSDAESTLSTLCLNDMQAVLISGNEIEIRAGFSIEFVPQYINECEIVNEITQAQEVDFPEFGVVIYNVQPGDTLWEICKRYGVDSEDVLKLNHELNESPEPGRKIYIFRRLVV